MLAIVGALAVIAVVRGTETMLTRIGVGLVIALALDPLTNAVRHRFGIRRGVAVAIVASFVFGLAVLLVVVLAPRAVAEARNFSEQLPETIRELEQLPLVGGYVRDKDIAGRAQEWVRELPQQFTDERVAEGVGRLVSGVAGVAIVTVVAVAVLIDGEKMLARLRRLLTPPRRVQADYVGGVLYRTLGRYFGGSVTVAILMGVYVLTLGLVLGIPLVPLAAVWAMLTDLIPQIGGFLGGSFFVLLALTQGRADRAHRSSGLRAVHEPREPRDPAGDRRAIGEPDRADDDGRRPRRRRGRRHPRGAHRHAADRSDQSHLSGSPGHGGARAGPS